MLTGLLFAIAEAEDRPDTLAATLPFGGVTLIEYQARLLAGAGASQIIVLVARLTPALLGALNRIGRHGIAVDAVRSAAEAVAKLHPLARVLVLADGLVTTEPVVAALAGEGGDVLLVADDGGPNGATVERIGGGVAWLGVARLDARRVDEAAALPRDYDLQSALLRVAAQAGARQVMLPEQIGDGHGIERRGAALASRGRAVLNAIAARRPGWVDRTIVAPLARILLPRAAERGIGAGALVTGGGVAALAGFVALAMDSPGVGLALVVLADVVLAMAASLGWLRDELRLVRVAEGGLWLVPAVAVALLGWRATESSGALALALAAGVLVTGALAERAAQGRHRPHWWALPAAYPLVILLPAAIGAPLPGLTLAWGYAALTAAAAIEQLRRAALVRP